MLQKIVGDFKQAKFDGIILIICCLVALKKSVRIVLFLMLFESCAGR